MIFQQRLRLFSMRRRAVGGARVGIAGTFILIYILFSLDYYYLILFLLFRLLILLIFGGMNQMSFVVRFYRLSIVASAGIWTVTEILCKLLYSTH